MKILWAKTWGQQGQNTSSWIQNEKEFPDCKQSYFRFFSARISILVPTWAQKQQTKSKVLAYFQLPTWTQKQHKNARFRAFLPKNQRFSTIFNCPPGYRNNQKTRVFARFYPKIKGFRSFSTRDNCGTDNCGTENCGTDNCGTDNCGTDNCWTENCGTDNCGTDNCGTENCGTENCGTDNCGTEN